MRDALRLPVEPATGIPPRLADEIPDRSKLLQGANAESVGVQWAEWWTAIGEFTARVKLGELPIQDIRAEQETVIVPEVSPDSGDSFRSVVQTLYREACDWFNHRPQEPSARGTFEGFQWDLIHDAVQAVASETGVSTGDINGAVSVLFVEGVWGAVARPGFAWCSTAAAHNPDVCSEIIRATLTSGLTRSN